MWRLRPAGALVAGALVLSTLGATLPIPFRPAGFFSLQAAAAVDQVLATLLVAAYLLVGGYTHLRLSWPLPALASLCLRTLGAWIGMGAWIGIAVGGQLLVAGIAGDLEGVVSTREEPLLLVGRYLLLFAMTGAFGLVVLAWGQLLGFLLRRTAALIGLLAMVLAGFVLPELGARMPALRWCVGILPDLAALSPLVIVPPDPPSLGPIFIYLPLHVGAVLVIQTITLYLSAGYGRSFDREPRTP